jgi:hypothetical protein
MQPGFAIRNLLKKTPKPPKKPNRSGCFCLSDFLAFFNMNMVTTKSEYLFLKVNVESASANVVMNDERLFECMHCKKKLIIKKE